MNKEIQDGNMLIAEFMGKTIKDDCIVEISQSAKCLSNPKGERQLPMQYHTSWDWLMVVVEKIEGMGHTTTIGTSGTNIQDNDEIQRRSISGVIFSIRGEKIKATYTAVLKFIQWYNTNPANQ